MRLATIGTALVLLLGTISASAADGALQFEVASVTLAPTATGRPRGRMGCFLSSPIRYTCANASVSLMAIQAYGLRAYQLRPPASEDATRFNVEAKLPPGATAEQVNAMLQNLLADRFKLVFHREKIEVEGYALLVAKGGPKIKEIPPEPASAPETNAPPPPPEPIKNPDGFNNLRGRHGFTVSRANGLTRWVGTEVPMDSAQGANLCGILNSIIGEPIVDATRLNGKYDVTFTFSTENATGEGPLAPQPDQTITSTEGVGQTVFEALERQLGLQLERRKATIEAFVIDRVEKKPTEN